MKRISWIVFLTVVIASPIFTLQPHSVAAQTAKDFFDEGAQLLQRGAFAEAEAAYAKAIGLDPAMAGMAHFQMAVAYGQHQRFNDAVTHYEKALEFKPQEPMIYANLANAYLSSGQFDKAIDTYNRLIAIDPNQAWPHYNLGNLYLQGQLYPQAIGSFKRVLEIDPSTTFGSIYEQLGYAYQMVQGYHEAVIFYGKAFEKNPKSFTAAYNLGICHFRLAEYDSSISAYQKAIALQPKSAEAITNLGLAYHGNKQVQEAEDALNQALALKPDLGEALFGMALVYREREDYDKALAFAQKAIDSGKKISPDFIERLKAKIKKAS